MMIIAAVVSSLLFVGGAWAYWVVSTPLKELPHYYQLLLREQSAENGARKP